ncbi:MAG: hypothetical protein U0Z44_03175 [Kouleothrix sp.]
MRLIRRTSDRSQDDSNAPRRILVADDDPSIATLIQVTLKDPRYEIVAVKKTASRHSRPSRTANTMSSSST